MERLAIRDWSWQMRATRWVAAAVTVLLIARVAAGQEVGTIAALEGQVEVGRAGTWAAANLGDAIQQGDTLRTGTPGRVRVVLQDDSVFTMADVSEITVDESIFDASTGRARTLLKLLVGKVRVLVSEYYERRGAQFNVETTTAVVGVRGTEFIVTFDPGTGVTEVIGVSGHAKVHSVKDRVGHSVTVTARELTSVATGQYPTTPQRISDERYQQYLDALEFTGGGRPESLVAGLPLMTGADVPEPERVSAQPAPALQGEAPRATAPSAADGLHPPRNASSLIGQPPALVDQGLVGIHF